MSRLRILGHKGVASGGGGGSTIAATYDTRFGTATDSEGWITFALKPGCRRVWVNSSGGNDANDGLSAANAKATFDAAATVFTNGSYSPGDQLMVAGTGGRTYTDSGSVTLFQKKGFSLAYPTAMLCYDPSDAANSAKYGKLTGANMPSISINNTPLFSSNAGDGTGTDYAFVQGIQLDGANSDGANFTWSGEHHGLGYQNCRFKTVELNFTVQNADGSASHYHHVSKCSFWGMWSSGSPLPSALFIGNSDGFYCQDNIFVHCGWKLGVSRTASTASGGPTFLNHGHYYSSHCTGGHIDRNVYVDTSRDGFNCRGDAAATCVVMLDEPFVIQFGGVSSSYTEKPLGSVITMTDVLCMGSARMDGSSLVGMGAIANDNTSNTSYIKNGAFIDNPDKVNNNVCALSSGNTGVANQGYRLDTVRMYNWASNTFLYGGAAQGGNAANLTLTAINSTFDVAVAGTGAVDGGGNSVWSGAPSGYKDRDTIISELLTNAGVTPSSSSYTARKAQLVNLMLWRPDAKWAQALMAIGLPTVGLTPIYSTASITDMSAESPASVY